MPLLQDEIAKLHAAAVAAARGAHAPYSRFAVGAAILTQSGKIYPGANVENASYGLTVCAERNAMFRAVIDRDPHPIAIAVVTPTDDPASPCGACRQVLMEFGPEMMVYCFGATGKMSSHSLRELLPEAFELKRGNHVPADRNARAT